MNFTQFVTYIVDYFIDMYYFTNSISPFSDFPALSLFWLFESTVLTSIAWQLFPDEFSDDFSECEKDSE